jgi:hypothetical protein
MRNFKKVLVKHLIDTTKKEDIPAIVSSEYKGDYKMYLYTLKTEQLGNLLLNR